LEDLGIGGRIILKWIYKWVGGMDQIDLAQNWERRQALVKEVMSLWVP